MTNNNIWTLDYPVETDAISQNALWVRGRTTSGAGQFELAGSVPISGDNEVKAQDIVGKDIVFEIDLPNKSQKIKIDESYPVREVGGKVRINIQGANGASRPNIGNLFAAFLLLPEVSQIGNALPASGDQLKAKTYWIDAVDVAVNHFEQSVCVLSPRQIIVATANKKDSSQFAGASVLDFMERLNQLTAICRAGVLITAGGVPAALKYYEDVFEGRTAFNYDIGVAMKKIMVDYLMRCSDVHYQQGDDLLAALDQLAKSSPISDTPDEAKPKQELRENIPEPHNLIYFGAPGTGKSFELREKAKEYFAESSVRRVTFHPDYTYAQFVGCYKPSIEPEINTKSNPSEIKYSPSEIEYKFIPGPFIDTYVDAIKHPGQNYLLIIEEINRANPAAVFGDVFQLLDRNAKGESEYPVATSEDLRWYLFKQWKSYLNGIKPEERKGALYSLDDPEAEKLASSMSLPSNMYIWATMNSADQGVFPMDTAFKRRWEFRYIGIDDGSKKIEDIVVPLGDTGRSVKWNDFRSRINDLLLKAGINEDKLLGPFFISPSQLRDPAHFTQAFMDKVLLYLFEDAAKTKKSKVFKREDNVTYSSICGDFKNDGESVFKDMEQLPEIDSQPAVDTEAADGQNDDGE